MRFNNKFCALMNIPDLPQGAFEHIGDRKIKPQGGGGGIVSAITDPISSAIGTDGGGGGVLGALADIDPGPAIGSGLADVDKFVGDEIPGGWTTVGAAAALGTGLYFAPELIALAGGEAAAGAAGTAAAEAGAGAIATEAGQAAFFNSLAAGASGAEAVSAGLAAETALGAGALTTEQILGSTGFTPAPGSGASFVVDPSVAYTTGVAQGAPVYDFSEPLYANQMGPTYQELGVTGVEGGMAGPTYQELGYTGLNQAEAIAAADAASAASKLSLNVGDVLKGVQQAKGLLGDTQQPQQQAPAQTPKSIMPRGQVDYSGILNLLQTRQQRNPYSLLG